MTPTHSPIVVPTDFSAAAAEAMAYAFRIARSTGAEVHLLHVASWPDAGLFEVPGEAPTAAREEAEEEALARDALAAASDAHGRGDASIVVRRSGIPAAEIVDYARQVAAGLIAIGRHGGRSRHAGLGPVAGEVLHASPCDVLLVPSRDGDPFSRSDVQRVLVPVDFSAAVRPLVGLGLEAARALGAGAVDLLHVLEPLPYPVRWIDEAVVDLVPTIRDRAVAALRDVADAAQDRAPEAPQIGVYVERGKAARTIVRMAVALGADLVVVGPHAERPAFDQFLGSVAEGVARRSPCPVLIARRTAALDGVVPTVDSRSYRSLSASPAPAVDARPSGV